MCISLYTGVIKQQQRNLLVKSGQNFLHNTVDNAWTSSEMLALNGDGKFSLGVVILWGKNSAHGTHGKSTSAAEDVLASL